MILLVYLKLIIDILALITSLKKERTVSWRALDMYSAGDQIQSFVCGMQALYQTKVHPYP